MPSKDTIVSMDGHHAMNAVRKAEYDKQEYLESLPGNPDNHSHYDAVYTADCPACSVLLA